MIWHDGWVGGWVGGWRALREFLGASFLALSLAPVFFFEMFLICFCCFLDVHVCRFRLISGTVWEDLFDHVGSFFAYFCSASISYRFVD